MVLGRLNLFVSVEETVIRIVKAIVGHSTWSHEVIGDNLLYHRKKNFCYCFIAAMYNNISNWVCWLENFSKQK
jgi:hypothetical protein